MKTLANYGDDTITLPHRQPTLLATEPTLPINLLCSHCQRLLAGETITLIVEQKRVLWKGKDLHLTTGEYRVVACLVSSAPHFVTYDKIYEAIRMRANFACGDYMANVRSMIRRIRRKFERADPSFDVIGNFQSYGYAWKSS